MHVIPAFVRQRILSRKHGAYAGGSDVSNELPRQPDHSARYKVQRRIVGYSRIDSWFETVLRVPDMANGKQQIRKIRDQCIAFPVVQCYNVDVKKCAIRGMAL